jgi:hypothetical protein
LNKHLTRDIPGTGYLAVDEDMTTGIPEIGPVSEEVWYACRFWLDHISDVDGPVSAEFMAALRGLLSTQLVLWIEIVAAKGEFQDVRRVREWIHVRIQPYCA